MKLPDLKSYISSLSYTKKVAIGFSVFLAIALLITGIVLLIFFMKKSTKNPKNETSPPKNVIQTVDNKQQEEWQNMGFTDFMNNRPKQTFDDLNMQNNYNIGWNEISNIWNINQSVFENQQKINGMSDMLNGLPDRSSELFVKYQMPYREGYSMSNETIISDALTGKLDKYNYYNYGVFTVSFGSVFKSEYSRGYDEAKGYNYNFTQPVNASGPFENGYFKKSLMSPKMLEITDVLYKKGQNDYYASDEYKNKVIEDYTKMGYADAGNELPKKELEEEYQIAYNKGWDEFMDNWITNRAKIENEQKLAGILFSIRGYDIGDNMGLPSLYEKSFYDGYYMSNENILKEALAGNLNTLIVGYVYSGDIPYIKGYIGKILLDDYAYAYNEGKRSLIDPSYRINGLRYDDFTYSDKFNTLRQMTNDAGFADAIATPIGTSIGTPIGNVNSTVL